MKIQKLAHRHVCLRVLCSVVVASDSTYFGTNDNETSAAQDLGGGEEGAKEAKSSEAKVKWPIRPSLPHPRASLVLAVFSLLPSISTRSTLSTIPSFVRFRLSFSFFSARTHTPSFLVFPLSPRINPCQSSLTISPYSQHPLHHDQSDSQPHPWLRCPILAASSSLPHPRCLTLAASSSLPYPRCIVVAPTPHLRSPLPVLLSPPTSGTPSLLLLFASCLLHCLLAC